MEKKALLVIDVQVGMFDEDNPVYHGQQLLYNIQKLISKARAMNTPIFFIQHTEGAGEQLEFGTTAWEIHPDVSPLAHDIIIQKTTPDSFFNTKLEEELNKRSITHLVLAGIQSDLCVDTTTRSAFSLNYNLTLASDAHSTWDAGELTAPQIIQHHNQVLYWFANIKKTSEIEL